MTHKRKDYLVLSDIHIGAKRTPAEEILAHLLVFFNDFRVINNFDDLKVIFIAGDLWDKAIQLGSPEIASFFRFWYRFCKWAIKKDIEIIVLEGTPDHDARQGQTLHEITQQSFTDLKFRYIKDLTVEYVEVLDMHVLFVPDECRETADKIYEGALQALADKNIAMADIAMMHGMFAYQLGNIPMSNRVHKEIDYLRIVKGFISIGHIHTASCFERIYAQGSFDRLSHGEEAPKGAYYFAEEKENQWTPIFLENKQAKQYRTFKLSGDFNQAMIEQLKRKLSGIPEGSYIRLQVGVTSSLRENKMTLSSLFPRYIFSVEDEKIATKKTKKIEVDSSYQSIVINEQTLLPVLLAEVKSRLQYSDERLGLLEAEMQSILQK